MIHQGWFITFGLPNKNYGPSSSTQRQGQGAEESLQGDLHPAGAAASFHPARCSCTAPENRAAPENAKAWTAGVGNVRRENGCIMWWLSREDSMSFNWIPCHDLMSERNRMGKVWGSKNGWPSKMHVETHITDYDYEFKVNETSFWKEWYYLEP